MKRQLLALCLGYFAWANAQEANSEDPCKAWDGSTQSLEFLQSLATAGCAPAQASLGLLYFKGDGVARDVPQAAQWYQKAAEGGSVSGQFNLALLYAQGNGVPQNWDLAARWMEAAAKQGHGPALPLRDAYVRARDRVLAVDKLLNLEFKELLAAYQAMQASQTKDTQERYQKAQQSLLSAQTRVDLGSWPTDGVKTRENQESLPNGSVRMRKDFQVVVPTDCDTDRFEVEGAWYQVKINPITRARIKAEGIQPGGAVEVKGKLSGIDIATWKGKPGPGVCGVGFSETHIIRLEVQF